MKLWNSIIHPPLFIWVLPKNATSAPNLQFYKAEIRQSHIHYIVLRHEQFSLPEAQTQYSLLTDIDNWALTCDFQQWGISTCVDSDEPVHPQFKFRNSKWCSVSSVTLTECSSDKQRFGSNCGYAGSTYHIVWNPMPRLIYVEEVL